MRRILNLIITGFILWVAANFFPPYVQIENFGILALATLLIWVIQRICLAICEFLMAAGEVCSSLFLILAALALALFTNIIAFSILSAKLPGFMVDGFWTKVVLSLCCSVLTISKPKNE